MSLSGRRVLVTAGPCREPIDPVRYISNRSSGKMGYALAAAAAESGAETILVSGPTDLAPPVGVETIAVETTAQMKAAVEKRFGKTDLLIMAAAPADYRPRTVAKRKIKKSDVALLLDLEPTADILKSLAPKRRIDQVVVGFALETDRGVDNARKKLRDKNLDMVVLNMADRDNEAFETDLNRATIILPRRKPLRLPRQSKRELARQILEMASSILRASV